jgi:hypothetical protein
LYEAFELYYEVTIGYNPTSTAELCGGGGEVRVEEQPAVGALAGHDS